MAKAYLKFHIGADGTWEIDFNGYDSNEMESNDASNSSGESKEADFSLVTNFEWEAELAERLFHVFINWEILECDKEKQEIRYSLRGHEMLDEIREAGAIDEDDESLDFFGAIMILAKYLGLVELVECEQIKERFKFTDYGLEIFYDLLFRLEDMAQKDDETSILK